VFFSGSFARTSEKNCHPVKISRSEWNISFHELHSQIKTMNENFTIRVEKEIS